MGRKSRSRFSRIDLVGILVGVERSENRLRFPSATRVDRRSVLRIPKNRKSGIPDFRNSRIPKTRKPGIPEIRNSGNPEFRTFGFSEFQTSGNPETRISRFLDFRKSGNPNVRISGMQTQAACPISCNEAVTISATRKFAWSTLEMIQFRDLQQSGFSGHWDILKSTK